MKDKKKSKHEEKLQRGMKQAFELAKQEVLRHERHLEVDRKGSLKRYYKKKKLNQQLTKNSDVEKLPGKKKTKPGVNIVKRDAQGHILPGQSLYPAGMWKPGQAPPGAGRPKKTALDDALLEFMAEEVIDLSRKKKHGRPRKNSRAKLLARALYIQAKAGHRGAMQLIYERVGGKPLQEIDAKIDATATAITPEQRNARIKELIARAGDL